MSGLDRQLGTRSSLLEYHATQVYIYQLRCFFSLSYDQPSPRVCSIHREPELHQLYLLHPEGQVIYVIAASSPAQAQTPRPGMRKRPAEWGNYRASDGPIPDMIAIDYPFCPAPYSVTEIRWTGFGSSLLPRSWNRRPSQPGVCGQSHTSLNLPSICGHPSRMIRPAYLISK